MCVRKVKECVNNKAQLMRTFVVTDVFETFSEQEKYVLSFGSKNVHLVSINIIC